LAQARRELLAPIIRYCYHLHHFGELPPCRQQEIQRANLDYSMMFSQAQPDYESTGPPPQAVLNQRPWWLLLIFILGTTLVLRVLSSDLLGGLLCGLMICLCAVILRDGMRELPKFALMFGLLCGINFVFYAMPVIGYIVSGKSEQHVQPMDSADFGSEYSHTHRLTYTLTVKTTPFFDSSKGLLYNARSVGELLMPIAMLIGTYLGVAAHYEFQSHLADFMADDDGFGGDAEIFTGVGAEQRDTPAALAARAGTYGAIFSAVAGGVQPSPDATKVPHKAFSGTAHKLG